MSTTYSQPKAGPNFSRLILGGALIVWGALIFLQMAGYGAAGQLIGDWWPIVIVFLGAAHIASSRSMSMGPLTVIAIGFALLAGTLGLVPGGTLALFWPLVLVMLGLSILIHRSASTPIESSDENHLALSATFSGVTHLSHASRFEAAHLNAMCGGIVLDLRQAALAPEGARVDATATCGGIEIRVPVGWHVEMSGTPILGGYDAKALEDETPEPGAPRLHVQVSALCGGVAVKH